MNIYMIKLGFFAVVSALGVFLGGCAQKSQTSQDLQAKLDVAAASNDKNVSLSGVYELTEPVRLNHSHSGLTIDGGGTAVISGGKQIKNWRKSDSGIWIADVDTKNMRSLFVDSKRAIPAQTENFFYMHSAAKEGTLGLDGKPLQSPEKSAFIARTEDVAELFKLSPEELKKAYIEVFTLWVSYQCDLIGVRKNDDSTTTVFVNNVGNRKFFHYKWAKPARFKICNLKSQLDKEGEFYFDNTLSQVSYIPRNGESTSSIAVYPVIEQVFVVDGGSEKTPVKDLSIQGVNFEYGGFLSAETTPMGGQAASAMNGFVSADYAQNLSIQNCKVSHCDVYGINLGKCISNSSVKDCVVYDTGSGGIKVGDPKKKTTPSANNKILNNIVYHYGRFDKSGVGIIVFDCPNNIIDSNTIFDGYYTGISVGWVWGFGKANSQNNKITNNKIFKIGHGLIDDMGAIYTLGDAQGSVISDNDVGFVYSHSYGGWGIYNDEGSNGYLVTNNYSHDVKEEPYHLHYGKNNVIKNNIFVNGKRAQVALGRRTKDYPDGFFYTQNIVVYKSPATVFTGPQNGSADKIFITPYNAKFAKNLYWNVDGDVTFNGRRISEWQATGQDADSVIADPSLDGTNLGNDNYKKIGFQPFSVADAGVKGNMKETLEKILDGYSYPKQLNLPDVPDWK